jgi:hypothetical protein
VLKRLECFHLESLPPEIFIPDETNTKKQLPQDLSIEPDRALEVWTSRREAITGGISINVQGVVEGIQHKLLNAPWTLRRIYRYIRLAIAFAKYESHGAEEYESLKRAALELYLRHFEMVIEFAGQFERYLELLRREYRE